jgi:ABC-type sugar transport system ATPase subunit
MSFALRMRNEKPDLISQRVKEAIRMLGLEGLESRKPRQLSGGQRQRVAMGRCIVRNPKLFLFDEPLSNLDAKLRNQTRLEIRRLHEKLGATSIFVTHDQVEAMTMADRIALLDKGHVQQIGTPQDLYNAPANRFVASFLGTPEMNFLGGTLALSGRGIRLDGVHNMMLPASSEREAVLRERLRDGAPVILGVRPEHLHVVTSGAESGLPIVIDAVEWLGHEVFVFGKAHDVDVAVRATITGSGDQIVLEPGQRLSVNPSRDGWHLFDSVTGKNLLL